MSYGAIALAAHPTLGKQPFNPKLAQITADERCRLGGITVRAKTKVGGLAGEFRGGRKGLLALRIAGRR